MVRVHASFVTRHDNRPHTCGIVVDGRDGEGAFSDYAALSRAAHAPGAAAYGKVAIIRRDGIAAFQVGKGKALAPAFCGNATAAALLFLTGGREAQTRVIGAGAQHEVHARIDGQQVDQTWLLDEGGVEERTWEGRRVVVLSTLNPYALIVGGLPDGVGADAARRQLLGPGLTAKLAVVDGDGEAPIVDFYNANGRHGGVPQTGLASIALAARRVAWFAALFPGRRALHRTHAGLVPRDVPEAEATADGRIAIAMPRVAVDLREMAAAA